MHDSITISFSFSFLYLHLSILLGFFFSRIFISVLYLSLSFSLFPSLIQRLINVSRKTNRFKYPSAAANDVESHLDSRREALVIACLYQFRISHFQTHRSKIKLTTADLQQFSAQDNCILGNKQRISQFILFTYILKQN